MSEKDTDDDATADATHEELDSVGWLAGRSSNDPLPARLPQTGGMRKLEQLLEAGERGVPELSSVALHAIVHEIGLDDASALLELATAEQVREVFDLQVWDADRIDREELLDWMHALVALPNDVRARHMRGLDVELVGALLRQSVRIYLREGDEYPEEPQGQFITTLDNWFVIDILEPSEIRAQQIVDVINALYEDDHEHARTFLQNLMWELPSELEEWALRWRNGRLEDLGFSDPVEAMQVFAYLAPQSVLDETTVDRQLASDPDPIGLPAEGLLRAAGDDTFWTRALGQIDDPVEIERLNQAMLFLANRVLAADRVPPSDDTLVAWSLQLLRARLSLALDYLCSGQPEAAPALLSKVALSRLARVGHSLVLDVSRPLLPAARAQLLGRSRRHFNFLPPLLARRMELLTAARPLLGQAAEPRPLSSVADLALAERWVEQALLMVELVPLHDRPVDHEQTLPAIFCSDVIDTFLGRERFRPYTGDDLTDLRQRLSGGFPPELERLARETTQGRVTRDRLRSASDLVAGWFTDLRDELMAIADPVVDPRYVSWLLVTPAKATATSPA